MSESQNIEYKESWRDEYLKWICGFANAQGGRIYIGVNDKQEIVGVSDSKRLMEDIPNKIINYLGIVADVNMLRSETGKEPLRFFPGVEFRIGRFGKNEADLIFQDVVDGNILQMADKVMALLRSKYLISPIHYEGMQRVESLEVPEDALREMIYNSLVHKLYVGVPIQMWVFDDHIELWNEGKLPEAITIDALSEKHSSHPRNQLVASVFYKAGFIESWGRGIRKINEAFYKAGIERPVFKESEGGLLVKFSRKYPTMISNVTDNVTDRYRTILCNMLDNNKISMTQLAEKLNLSKRTVLRDISILKKKNLIERIGSEKNGYWHITEKGKTVIS